MKNYFKQISPVLSIGVLILLLTSFTNTDSPNNGALGDVKYSVLPPDKFKEENGAGWELMDDKLSLDSSPLKAKHGITQLPDARGVFIRGLNLKRSDGKGDTFEEEKGHDRLMGEYQADAFQEHAHDFEYKKAKNNSSKGGGANHEVTDGDETKKSVTALKGGKETRPKNIALYIYVKTGNN